MSNKFYVVQVGSAGKRSRCVGVWYSRMSTTDTIERIFGCVHHLASHSTPVHRMRWRGVEQRMLDRFGIFFPHLPNKRERL